MDMEKFAARLSLLREQKGFSARDMSLSIGQSACYINKIENRRTLPSLSTFFNICDFLNISAKDFFDEDVKNPEYLNALTENLKKLNNNSLAHIKGIVEILIEAQENKNKTQRK